MLKVKNIHRLFSITLIFLALLTFITVVAPVTNADQDIASKATDAYDFPIKFGDTEWETLESHDAMLEACQVPESILKGMSTTGLVETVLNYPLYEDMFAYNRLQDGFDAVVARFNGLQELLGRKDAGVEVLAVYHDMDPTAIVESWTSVDKGKFAVDFHSIEILLSQDAILDDLTKMQIDQLLDEALKKSQGKAAYPEIYGWTGLESTAMLAGRALQHIEAAFNEKVQADENLKAFLETGSFAGTDLPSSILEEVSEYLDNALSWSSSTRWDPEDYLTYEVETPNGTTVSPTYKDLPELSPALISYYNSWADNYSPGNAYRVATATQKYNCHSYAWHEWSVDNIYWIDSPGDDTYWNDGSYVVDYSPNANNIIRWNSADHSGVLSVYNSSSVGQSWVFSKWGSLPLMLHKMSVCPYTTTSVTFFEPES